MSVQVAPAHTSAASGLQAQLKLNRLTCGGWQPAQASSWGQTYRSGSQPGVPDLKLVMVRALAVSPFPPYSESTCCPSAISSLQPGYLEHECLPRMRLTRLNVACRYHGNMTAGGSLPAWHPAGSISSVLP